MVRFLGLARGDSYESPREIASRATTASENGESGWLIRFFDSAFFCEWIAVSYLYKHEHSGVRDYLCNRMYTLPISGLESYLFQICYLMVHKPSPSLDKFVIDMCSKSLNIALKVHWLLAAELDDSDDTDGISRIQEKCQIASILMGEWSPLVRPQGESMSPGSKNQVLNRLLSSKQQLLSLVSSPPDRRSMSFSPSSGNNWQEDAGQLSPDENNIFKKFIPSPKVRDAFSFRKSAEKDGDENEKDGFFKRLLRDSRNGDDSGSKIRDTLLFRKSSEKDDNDSEKESFFKRFLRDSRGEDEDATSSSEGFFKRLFHDNKNDSGDKIPSKSGEIDEKDGFFRKIFKDKFEDKRDGNNRNEDDTNSEEKCSKSREDDEKEGFFRKLFRDKFEDKNDITDKVEDANGNGEEDEPSDFSLFRRLFRVHPEEVKSIELNDNNNIDSLPESSRGTENFFRKLFRDRDRSIEDSELFGLKKHNEVRLLLASNSFSRMKNLCPFFTWEFQKESPNWQ